MCVVKQTWSTHNSEYTMNRICFLKIAALILMSFTDPVVKVIIKPTIVIEGILMHHWTGIGFFLPFWKLTLKECYQTTSTSENLRSVFTICSVFQFILHLITPNISSLFCRNNLWYHLLFWDIHKKCSCCSCGNYSWKQWIFITLTMGCGASKTSVAPGHKSRQGSSKVS